MRRTWRSLSQPSCRVDALPAKGDAEPIEKNKQCHRYSSVTFNHLNIFNACSVAVIPFPETTPAAFRCTAFDSNGSRHQVNREIKSGYDIVDAVRLSEYASLSKRRFHELRVGKDDGVSAQIVCACSDHAEQALLEKAETIVPQAARAR